MSAPAPGGAHRPDEPRCYNCGIMGHWAVACPEPTRQTPAGLEAWRSAAPSQQNNRRDNRGSSSKTSKAPIITRYAPPPTAYAPQQHYYQPPPGQYPGVPAAAPPPVPPQYPPASQYPPAPPQHYPQYPQAPLHYPPRQPPPPSYPPHHGIPGYGTSLPPPPPPSHSPTPPYPIYSSYAPPPPSSLPAPLPPPQGSPPRAGPPPSHSPPSRSWRTPQRQPSRGRDSYQGSPPSRNRASPWTGAKGSREPSRGLPTPQSSSSTLPSLPPRPMHGLPPKPPVSLPDRNEIPRDHNLTRRRDEPVRASQGIHEPQHNDQPSSKSQKKKKSNRNKNRRKTKNQTAQAGKATTPPKDDDQLGGEHDVEDDKSEHSEQDSEAPEDTNDAAIPATDAEVIEAPAEIPQGAEPVEPIDKENDKETRTVSEGREEAERSLTPGEETSDWEWEEKMAFVESQIVHESDPVGKPLPVEYTEDVMLPPKWDAKCLVSEFFTHDNVEEFSRPVHETKHWALLQFDPVFAWDGRLPSGDAFPRPPLPGATSSGGAHEARDVPLATVEEDEPLCGISPKRKRSEEPPQYAKRRDSRTEASRERPSLPRQRDSYRPDPGRRVSGSQRRDQSPGRRRSDMGRRSPTPRRSPSVASTRSSRLNSLERELLGIDGDDKEPSDDEKEPERTRQTKRRRVQRLDAAYSRRW
ncbi:uncharacterized protein F5Z01DRAFT_100261 [Emericellopsis atlantica]|uniref:CCHC-type domain-containing protein n=1 Tax=Emericellopsis atlantica TaxID=2614577 RepID=A0A9P7ZMA0_9HYPO|nr:uncharacterized protein F5Z01DRAFT_100261 [Emericellopsis atlantica]KAG9254286.1 hypothetical protein F5Z01DRAFT_100261 [Emericellopsis atlantica]